MGVLLAADTKSERSTEMAQDIKPEIGTSVLFENEQLKIWDLQLEPGEKHGLHRHENDYVLVFIGDCRLRGVNEDGSTRFEQDMHDGDTFFRKVQGEDVHDAMNVGQSLSRNIIIELKTKP